MNYTSRKTHAIINLTAIKSNYQLIDNLAVNSATIAIIKGDAYGHGAIEVAKSLDNLVAAFAVAFIDEAVVLRDAGITSPLLILEGPLSVNDFAFAAKHNLWLMLHNHQQISDLMKQKKPYLGKIWLKFDTGMNRLGFTAREIKALMPKVLSRLLANNKDSLVLCSHFSNAEEKDHPKTLQQLKDFETIQAQYNCLASLGNSAGVIQWPQSHYHFTRLGIALYGINPIPNIHHAGNSIMTADIDSSAINVSKALIPVMTLKSSIISLRKLVKGDCVGYGETWQAQRDSVIATVAIGYADGYPHNAKSGTPVLINHQRAPLAGAVSMDMITVDVTELTQVNLGDEVELWGENLPVEIIAQYVDTISYELLTRVAPRVPKRYLT